ncbi:hypothetical protein FOZ62_005496, partial [Perkinsus olseni]
RPRHDPSNQWYIVTCDGLPSICLLYRGLSDDYAIARGELDKYHSNRIGGEAQVRQDG